MSLKAFHVVFICCAVLLCAWFGIWSWRQGQASGESKWMLIALGSFVVAVGLVAYEIWFLRRTRQVSPW